MLYTEEKWAKIKNFQLDLYLFEGGTQMQFEREWPSIKERYEREVRAEMEKAARHTEINRKRGRLWWEEES